jgi:hypothetical protein
LLARCVHLPSVEQTSFPRKRGKGRPFRGLAVDAGVRGCAEVRSHISEARCGAPRVCFA